MAVGKAGRAGMVPVCVTPNLKPFTRLVGGGGGAAVRREVRVPVIAVEAPVRTRTRTHTHRYTQRRILYVCRGYLHGDLHGCWGYLHARVPWYSAILTCAL